MPEKMNNLQDIFLNTLRRSKTPVTMFLVKGVKLQGIITWFDNFSVLLRRDGQSQLVYKHAISTVMPSITCVFISVVLSSLRPSAMAGGLSTIDKIESTAARMSPSPTTAALVLAARRLLTMTTPSTMTG